MIWQTADSHSVQIKYGDTHSNPDDPAHIGSPYPLCLWVRRVNDLEGTWHKTNVNSLSTMKRIITSLTWLEFYDWLQEVTQ